MRKIALGLIVFVVLAFVCVSLAQEKTAPAPEKMKLQRFSGVIEKADAAGKTVEVKGKEKTLVFAIDENTKIMKSKTELALTGLKKGMRVSVAYKKEGDKLIAASIKAASSRASKKSKPAEETTK